MKENFEWREEGVFVSIIFRSLIGYNGMSLFLFIFN